MSLTTDRERAEQFLAAHFDVDTFEGDSYGGIVSALTREFANVRTEDRDRIIAAVESSLGPQFVGDTVSRGVERLAHRFRELAIKAESMHLVIALLSGGGDDAALVRKLQSAEMHVRRLASTPEGFAAVCAAVGARD